MGTTTLFRRQSVATISGQRCDHPEIQSGLKGRRRSPWSRKPVQRAEAPSSIDLQESLSGLFSSMNSSIAAFAGGGKLPAARRASIAERATQVGLSEGTLEKEIREGRLEAFKVKSRTLIGDEAFDRWLEARERIKPKRPPAGPEILEAT